MSHLLGQMNYPYYYLHISRNGHLFGSFGWVCQQKWHSLKGKLAKLCQIRPLKVGCVAHAYSFTSQQSDLRQIGITQQ